MGSEESRPDSESTCERCGGDAVPSETPGVTLLECVDCGNVVGIAGEPEETPDSRSVDTQTVTATDGELDQLVMLLRSRGADGIHADELRIEAAGATLVITAADGELRIREADSE
ncbi:hypothetical protein [Natronomonas gomsonensis]|uniref:hypothetical protein n=1 Tax=Natronomonas gomsonensis TaxID=1046043 RepID=UPI0015BC9AF1|nr:hypothetical protein [Natronomonas gomsonensis]